MAASMTMDFFAHQDSARKKTSLLVFYYVLAVVLIVVGVYLAFAGVWLAIQGKLGYEVGPAALWQPRLFLWVTLVTVALVGTGSAHKIRQLGGGGEAVARLLGGRPVTPNSGDADERKLLNVVEEMAIAAGTPVPRVFLLEQEEGINAFAAGFAQDDAVIAVTKGCMRLLSRDELQGVIAHEFSHILNGDMRLNLRLMGVLHGILLIGIAGYWILRVTASSGRSRSRDSKGAGGAVMLLGLIVMAIGYIGVFFGKLIKSAVSRQREFLADASAVQYTRNPGGIAGALRKIGGFAFGSRIQDRHAEEASHLFFCNGLGGTWGQLLATHPPLDIRIRRLDPAFDGTFVDPGTAAPLPQSAAGAAPPSRLVETRRFSAEPGEVMARVGAPRPEHLDHAARLIASLPAALVGAAHDPLGACAVVYGLLLNREPEPRRAQLAWLETRADSSARAQAARRIMGWVEQLGPAVRLPLLDISVGALRQLSAPQYEAFVEDVRRLAGADRQTDLFEFMLERTIRRRLDPVFRKTPPPIVRHAAVPEQSAAALLSSLAYWGTDDPSGARHAFAAGAGKLRTARPLPMLPVEACGLNAVGGALAELAGGGPPVKKRVLDACVTCVGADGQVTLEEAELLRAVGDSLGCPIPPWLPGQAV